MRKQKLSFYLRSGEYNESRTHFMDAFTVGHYCTCLMNNMSHISTEKARFDDRESVEEGLWSKAEVGEVLGRKIRKTDLELDEPLISVGFSVRING